MAVIEEYINNYINEAIEKKLKDLLLAIATPNVKPVYTNKEMIKLLDVDAKTLKKYRDEGLLGFSHPYDKYYYTHQDLVKFLMNKSIRYEPFRAK